MGLFSMQSTDSPIKQVAFGKTSDGQVMMMIDRMMIACVYPHGTPTHVMETAGLPVRLSSLFVQIRWAGHILHHPAQCRRLLKRPGLAVYANQRQPTQSKANQQQPTQSNANQPTQSNSNQLQHQPTNTDHPPAISYESPTFPGCLNFSRLIGNCGFSDSDLAALFRRKKGGVYTEGSMLTSVALGPHGQYCTMMCDAVISPSIS